MTKFKTIIASFITVTIIGASFPASATTNAKTFFDGDAIVYKSSVYVSTTNMGGVKVYKEAANKLTEFVSINSFEFIYGNGSNYQASALSVEADTLYLYLVRDYIIYKYDISNANKIVRIAEIKNNQWDKYAGIKIFGNRVVTIGTGGVKVHDVNLNVVDSHKVYNAKAHNVGLANFGKTLVNVNDSVLHFYDTTKHAELATTSIVNERNQNRNFYSSGNEVYVATDKMINIYNHQGKLLGQVKHGGNTGYDVAGSFNKFAYVTTGDKILKLDVSKRKVVKSVEAIKLGTKKGTWAIAARVVKSGNNDKVVVFANSSIVILDSNLKQLTYQAIK